MKKTESAAKKADAPKAKKTAAKPREQKAVDAPEAPTVASGTKAIRSEKIIVLHPHITEKATTMAEEHVYTFVVGRNANKIEIKKAIKQLYKVTPIAIRIVNKAPRMERMARGRNRRPFRRPGMKKAYVTLKKGEQISFV
jgi:large subunit ribosomal protein L23